MQTAVANFCPSPDHPHVHHNIDDEFKQTNYSNKEETHSHHNYDVIEFNIKVDSIVLPNQLVQLP